MAHVNRILREVVRPGVRAAVESVQRISADQDTRHANLIKFQDRQNDFVWAIREGLGVDRSLFTARNSRLEIVPRSPATPAKRVCVATPKKTDYLLCS